jgi:hypothetical protein
MALAFHLIGSKNYHHSKKQDDKEDLGRGRRKVGDQEDEPKDGEKCAKVSLCTNLSV